MEQQHQNLGPKIGIGIIIFKEGKILLGKRKGSHGEGEYQSPGGHLDYMESFEESARRELAGECGIEIDNIRFQCIANVKEYAPKHYVLIGFTAEWVSGEPQILEPEKCESWDWYDLDNLPSPLFATIPLQIEAYKTGRNYFDA